ncbi:MAG: hypothetical protein Q9178_001426 [Gyalolechia marmorata]
MTSHAGPLIKRKSVPLIGQSAESFQIGPLSPSLSESLTNGTSIPAPAPPTPPSKEPSIMEHPSTPPEHPQTTLSNTTYKRYFPSTSYMPGAFPTEDSSPQANPSHTSSKLQRMGYEASASASPSPYAPSSQPSATSPSPRRTSSVFRLFAFKRKHDDRTSSSVEPVSSSGRPQSRGADSVIGSLADSGGGGHSLKKKKSGSFWGRRQSSLNFVTGAEAENGTPANPIRQRTVSSNSNAVSGPGNVGDGVVFAEGEEEEFPPRLKKKKSLTFWRRGSSLGLERMGSGSGNGREQHHQQQHTRNGSMDNAVNGHHPSAEEDTVMSERDSITLRSSSPPPVLPEVGYVVHEKGGLMGGEDWFGNIQ